MKKWMLLTLLFLVLVTAPVSAANGDYVLHSGDMLGIDIYGYPELSYPAIGHPEGLTIRPDGKITYPLLGEIVAEGITAKEFARLLTDKLSHYYLNPAVSVNLMRMGTERVYVLGEVNQPGSYELDKSRNLLDAIGAARGWTKDAAKTKIFLIRKNSKGEPPTKINLMALLKEGDTSKNVPLQQGDVVFLTGNNRIDFARDVLPFISAAYMITYIGDRNR